MRLRLAPKLTDGHIFQKPFNNGKVARATQVLCGSVCLALLSLVYAKELPDSARSTAYFCDQMDKLFDCLNSCCSKKTEPKLWHAISKGKSELIELLKQLPWIAAWKFEGRRQPDTIIRWQIKLLKLSSCSGKIFHKILTSSFCSCGDCNKTCWKMCLGTSAKSNVAVATWIPMCLSSSPGSSTLEYASFLFFQIRGMWRMIGQTSFKSSHHFLFVSHHLQTLWKLSLQTTFLL